MATDIAALSIVLTAESAKFLSEMERAQKRSKSFSQAVGRHYSNITRSASIMAVGIGAAATAVIKHQAGVIDQIAKTSAEIGINVQAYQGLTFAAELNGAKQEDLRKVMLRMQKSAIDAREGIKEQEQAFNRLGIKANEFINLKTEDQFSAIADNIGKIANQTERVELVRTILGKPGSTLIQTLSLGAEGLAAMKQEAIDLGLAFNRVDAAKVEAANDAMLRVSKVVEGMGNKLTIAVAPIIAAFADRFTDAAKNAKGFDDVIKTVIKRTAYGVGVMADGLHGIRIIFKGLVVGANALAVAFWKILNVLSEVSALLVKGILSPFTTLLKIAAKFNDTAKSALKSVNEFIDLPAAYTDRIFNAAADNLKSARDDFIAALTEDLPSSVIKSQIESILKDAEKKAQEIAKQAQERIVAGKDSASAQIIAPEIFGAFTTNRETAGFNIEEQQATMDSLSAITDLYESSYADRIEIARNAQQQMDNFAKLSAANQVAIVSGGFAKATAAMAQHSRAFFNINKVSGIANAIINTAQGVTEALKLPFPLNLAAAASTAAAGAAQILAIKSTSFSGGGSAPSVSDGAGVPTNFGPSAQEAAPQQQQSLPEFNINSAKLPPVMSREYVSALFDEMNAFMRDGGKLEA